MKASFDVTLCDITGEVFKNSTKTTCVEVYLVGSPHPEENEVLTVLHVDKSILPDYTSEIRFYVDSSNNLVLFGDKGSVWTPSEEYNELVEYTKNTIDNILSHDYDESDAIESAIINGKQIQ